MTEVVLAETAAKKDEYATLQEGIPPDWADGFGVDDDFGGFVELWVGNVSQRFRWVPQGRFTMGAPIFEEGRGGDEAQFDVTLTQGFWLADTPCTQAMWRAVMRDNPSRFRSQDRPVERVSFVDTARFFEKLNDPIRSGLLRLPTEAEWEYACRAGTTTGTYIGNMRIKGDFNCPALDEIAWYGGNSGVGFELKNGHDISDRSGKQYPDTPSGTHPVKQKAPNRFGLYDMLGNVWEWCSDWYGTYPKGKKIVNPEGASPSKGVRVIRGGSWYVAARYARSAARFMYAPESRSHTLGFRIACSPMVG